MISPAWQNGGSFPSSCWGAALATGAEALLHLQGLPNAVSGSEAVEVFMARRCVPPHGDIAPHSPAGVLDLMPAHLSHLTWYALSMAHPSP